MQWTDLALAACTVQAVAFDLEDTSNAPALTLHRPIATDRANT